MNGAVVVSGAGPTPTPTSTPVPVPTATPITGAPGIPDLDAGGRILLAFTLAAVGVAVLLLIRRR